MSEQKDFDRYLRGEYYPGAPKTAWRVAMEADFEIRGVSFDSRPVPQKKAISVVHRFREARYKKYLEAKRAGQLREWRHE